MGEFELPRHLEQQVLPPRRADELNSAGHSAALVAAETGYADQSHLHRDVAAFTNATPTTVAAAPWMAVDHIAWPS